MPPLPMQLQCATHSRPRSCIIVSSKTSGSRLKQSIMRHSTPRLKLRETWTASGSTPKSLRLKQATSPFAVRHFGRLSTPRAELLAALDSSLNRRPLRPLRCTALTAAPTKSRKDGFSMTRTTFHSRRHALVHHSRAAFME